jgi:hypothetical protein
MSNISAFQKRGIKEGFKLDEVRLRKKPCVIEGSLEPVLN